MDRKVIMQRLNINSYDLVFDIDENEINYLIKIIEFLDNEMLNFKNKLNEIKSFKFSVSSISESLLISRPTLYKYKNAIKLIEINNYEIDSIMNNFVIKSTSRGQELLNQVRNLKERDVAYMNLKNENATLKERIIELEAQLSKLIKYN